jgi:ABC-type phosphate/phosphonate transport system substrate-binding protein
VSNAQPSFFSVCPHDTARGIEKWALFNTYMNKHVGLKSRFHFTMDFAEFAQDVDGERLLWAYVNPADYLKVSERFGYEPIARPAERFDIAYVVRKSGSELPPQLIPGSRIAAVKGYLFFLVRHELAAAGIPFTTVPAKSYAEVLSLVERGEADAGVTYNEHFEPLAASTKEKFTVMHKVHPGLSHVVVAHPSIPAKTREEMRALLLAAATDPDAARLLEELRIRSFETVPEAPFRLLKDSLQEPS